MKLKKRKGAALLLAIIFSVLFVAMAITIAIVTISNIKTTTELKRGLKTFYGAEGGVFAVAGWIMYHRTIKGLLSELDVVEPCHGQVRPEMGCYRVKRVAPLPGMDWAKGYSSNVWNTPILINSEAPPNNPVAEVEATVLIPLEKEYPYNEKM